MAGEGIMLQAGMRRSLSELAELDSLSAGCLQSKLSSAASVLAVLTTVSAFLHQTPRKTHGRFLKTGQQAEGRGRLLHNGPGAAHSAHSRHRWAVGGGFVLRSFCRKLEPS